MSAPYRIRRTDVGVTKVSRGRDEALKQYLDRLMRIIPGEVVGLYLIGSGFVPEKHVLGQFLWFAFCLAALIVIRLYGTADPSLGLPPQIVPVAASAVAFVVWVYTVGGPFRAVNIDIPWIGSLLVLATSFGLPFVVKGDIDA
jgi:hypothetical protein